MPAPGGLTAPDRPVARICCFSVSLSRCFLLFVFCVSVVSVVGVCLVLFA